jgi:hypothetical protein
MNNALLSAHFRFADYLSFAVMRDEAYSFLQSTDRLVPPLRYDQQDFHETLPTAAFRFAEHVPDCWHERLQQEIRDR